LSTSKPSFEVGNNGFVKFSVRNRKCQFRICYIGSVHCALKILGSKEHRGSKKLRGANSLIIPTDRCVHACLASCSSAGADCSVPRANRTVIGIVAVIDIPRAKAAVQEGHLHWDLRLEAIYSLYPLLNAM
jgi:hypothetical protein